VADFLQTEILHRYPGVYEVVTDRGGKFGAKFSMFCKAWEIKHVKIAAKNPKANGQVERYMRVIKVCAKDELFYLESEAPRAD
jgi:hypothetical protein